MSASYAQVVLILLAALVATAVAAILQVIRARDLGAKASLARRMLRDLARAADRKLGVGEALARIMDIVAELVEADHYCSYLREQREGTLVVRAIKSAQIDAQVGPSYSGLVSTAKDAGEDEYTPPLGLSPDSQPERVSILRTHGETVLCVPLWSGDVLEGVIHAGPVAPRKVTAGQLRTLSELAPLLANMVGAIVEREGLKRQVEESSAMSHVSATMMRSTFQGEATMGLFLNLGSGIIEADGGMVVVRGKGEEPPWTPAYWGLSEDARGAMAQELGRVADVLATEAGPSALVAGTDGDGGVPERLAGMGINSVWVVPFVAEMRTGAVLYWFRSSRHLEGYMRPVLEMISGRVASAIRNIGVYEEMLRSYLETLTSIVDLLDSQEPSTVSHSTLISQYSRDTALAMGLPPEEVEAISLAAYLHDIGMIGLGEGVLFRKGKLTEGEYESVKRHVLLGATLTEPVSKPLPISPLIRHHHERYDGWGYPAGLRGGAIPLGARIIAVADTFNAKVSSRSYRKPLSYEKAVADIVAAAGSDLDPGVVDAFVKSWEAKQKSPHRRGKSLEDCWVMKRCPPRIASVCPAYKSGRNCWEVSGTTCAMHGDECETCLVYTECRARQRKHHLQVIPGGKAQE